MTAITFGSVCSGIEAASVAWAPLGWRAAWLAEIEPYPCKVLAHYYPKVPNLGNMLAIPAMLRNGDIPAPDVFTGGTPCQAFSVAGLRASLKDARGNLSMTFCEIADEIDIQRAAAGFLPCVVVWENVPGVLSTKDNAFGCFLGGLAGESEALVPEPCPAAGKSGKFWKWNKKDGQHTLSWPQCGVVLGPTRAVAWRVFDAQYFGLAQRRKRVFLVASAREGFDPAAVLLEFDGVRRDSAPSRSAWQDTAASTVRSTDGGSDVDHALAGHLAPYVPAISHCLNAGGMGRIDYETEAMIVDHAPIAFDSRQQCVSSTEVFGALGSSSPQAQAVSYAIQAGALRTNPASGPDGVGVQEHIAYTLEARAEVQAVCVTGDITHTLKAEGFDASEDGTGRGQPIVAFNARQDPDSWVERTGPLDTDGSTQAIQTGMAVRRLMPIECEKLQGFAPGYTLIPIKKVRSERLLSPKKNADGIDRYIEIDGQVWQLAADGPRYKALGNSWAIPCVYRIGARIDQQLRQAENQAAA